MIQRFEFLHGKFYRAVIYFVYYTNKRDLYIFIIITTITLIACCFIKNTFMKILSTVSFLCRDAALENDVII